MKLFKLPFIFFGSKFCQFFENDVKVFYIIESAKQGYLFVGATTADQKLLGSFDALFVNVRSRSTAVILVKKFIEIGTADMRFLTYSF